MKETYTIGLSYGFHDSAICFLDSSGRIAFAAQEERFTRRKNDPSFPIYSIKSGIDYLGINYSNVKRIGFYENPLLKAARICRLNSKNCYELLNKRISRDPNFLKPLNDLLVLFPEAEFTNHYPHHLSHAASSLFTDDSDSGLSIVLDGVGEFDSTSIWFYESGIIKRLGGTHIPNSIGLLYSAITSFLDFKVNDGEYKVMGLASFGEPLYANKLREIIHLNNDIKNPYTISQEHLDLAGNSDLLYTESFKSFLGLKDHLRLSSSQTYDDIPKEVFQIASNLASSIQIVSNEVVNHVFRLSCNKYPNKTLYYSGGVALNCAINRELLKNFGEVKCQPACGDAGGAMGCAFLAHHQFEQKDMIENDIYISNKLTNEESVKINQANLAYLGNDFSNYEVKEILEYYSISNYREFKNEAEMIKQSALDLKNGSVIGWFQGRMEWGPRSLGARSILAIPSGIDTQDKINRAVKFRESFRPFAPIFLKSFYNEFVEIESETQGSYSAHQYMLATIKTSSISKKVFPACVHIDQTARIQIVDDSSKIHIARLLHQMKHIESQPILLNTSFNLKGEPIVCTPKDALGTFWHSNLDYLYINNFRIKKENL